MKDKILIFVIGLLVGAIIATAGFLIYEKVNKNSNNQIQNVEQREMRERQNGEKPPEMLDSTQPNGEEPSEIPETMQKDGTKREKQSKDKSSTKNTTNENSTV